MQGLPVPAGIIAMRSPYIEFNVVVKEVGAMETRTAPARGNNPAVICIDLN
jgi:hypothetical protein